MHIERQSTWRRLFWVSPLMLGLLIFAGVLTIGRTNYAHIFSRNYRESAKRFACRSNLKSIAKVLQDKSLDLNATNAAAIQTVIDDLNLVCPSGRDLFDSKKRAFYQLQVMGDGSVVITENEAYHDVRQMWFVNQLSSVKYILVSDSQIYEISGLITNRSR